MKQSKRWTLNGYDYKRLAINAALIGLSAMVTYLIQEVPKIDFGNNSMLVQAVVMLILKAIQKLYEGK